MGEGVSENYNPNDLSDIELLRFYVQKYIDGEWEEVSNASYCTLFPVTASDKDKEDALEILMKNFF